MKQTNLGSQVISCNDSEHSERFLFLSRVSSADKVGRVCLFLCVKITWVSSLSCRCQRIRQISTVNVWICLFVTELGVMGRSVTFPLLCRPHLFFYIILVIKCDYLWAGLQCYKYSFGDTQSEWRLFYCTANSHSCHLEIQLSPRKPVRPTQPC